MPLNRRIMEGQRLPYAVLAELSGHEKVEVATEALFAGRNAVVMGMPGAFSPVCAAQHLPNFIENAERLRTAGYDLLVCILPNDPWVVDRWAQEVDPAGKIRFLSDGNLELTRKLGLIAKGEAYHLGERSERYCLILRDRTVVKVQVEKVIDDFVCSRADLVLD